LMLSIFFMSSYYPFFEKGQRQWLAFQL